MIRQLLLVVVFGSVLSGCIVSREISHIRNEIEAEFPGAEFDTEVIISVGPGLFKTLGWILSRVPDEDANLAAAFLRDVHRVKVGVFRTRELPIDGDLELHTLRRFEREGWSMAARVREDDEQVWVMYRERYGHIRDMFVLVLDPDELVIVRFEGNLNEIVRLALEDEMFVMDIFG
jgi:hypothetical protein